MNLNSLTPRLNREILVSVSIAATPEQVWDYVQDISSHVEWMHDAAEITFVSEREHGLGTSFDCLTKVGPLKLVDRMTITEWLPNLSMRVRHEGLVVGEGTFTLHRLGGGRTVFSWRERLVFPWFFGGPLGAWCARPVLNAIWRRNLAKLRARIEERQ